uniref:Rho-GAP domain-containing protein n=1 Tax=Kwoniella bestiolae CBS 10118 TaxID=1296100 RepID=A0A1B9G162_9TREE|nr:hypothetical protein I302_06224 [Kwoniella bestiolae CBS 10118]OCF24763.1 hypothetical protein I302_06224 [Kwoniella bestiolae CBS 10118]
MSPSRIPRPGGTGSPTITTSPLSQSTTTRPALGTLVHTSKNPFAQLHNKQSPGPHGSPTPSNGSGNLTVSKNVPMNSNMNRRRIKPPSPDLNDDSSFAQPVSRRPVPPNGGGSRIPSGPSPGSGPHQRSIIRQPSTPLLVSNRSPQSGNGTGRPRALSSTSVNRPIIIRGATPNPHHGEVTSSSTKPEGGGMMCSLPSQKLFESSFLESREPPVPPHIRVRLRLIHQLGVVLGIDAVGISGKIDIPGLLARVDQAYDREKDRSSAGPEVVALKGTIQGGGGKGVLGMFKKLSGGGGRRVDEAVGAGAAGCTVPQEGPAFGVPLSEAPPGSWCTSLIGGQKHELPLVVFTIVEEIYRRGMSQPGIFRLAGDGIRISHLTKVFNLPPLYGDSLAINQEPIHNLTGLVKRYVRDLPEPILDETLFPAFLAFCVGSDTDNDEESDKEESKENTQQSRTEEQTSKEPKDSTLLSDDILKLPLETRTTAAQILLKLLPPLQFSLFIYLLAFLGQLPLFPDNRLNIESISIIFGPAMCAARGKGISGLGPSVITNSNNTKNVKGGKGTFDPDSVSELVAKSQNVLGWLLRHWGGISEKVLEEEDLTTTNNAGTEDMVNKEKKIKKEKQVIDPRLLSPIDLRGSNDGMRARKPDSAPNSKDKELHASKDGSAESVEPSSPQSPNIQTPHTTIQVGMGLRKSSSSHTLKSSGSGMKSSASSSSGLGMKTSPSSGGLFARALSSMSISSQAGGNDHGMGKGPKRSASFTSLSSLVKKVGKEGKHSAMPHSTVNPQITTVLGSLHDLLVSKDKQIERDARELALLRHTLLEMDEKLQKATLSSPLPGPVGINGCTCPVHPNATISTSSSGNQDKDATPEITITSTPSSKTIPTSNSYSNLNKEINDLQTQLSTALAGLETSRLATRKQAERILVLEAKNSRFDSERKMEIGKLQVALALEQARSVGLIEERDLARERLEKVKTTLFSVA